MKKLVVYKVTKLNCGKKIVGSCNIKSLNETKE